MIFTAISSNITKAISEIPYDSVSTGIQKEIAFSKSVPFVLTAFFVGLMLLFYLSYLISKLFRLDQFKFKKNHYD